MKKALESLSLTLLIIMAGVPLFGQTGKEEPDIRKRIALIEQGNVDEVRAELPALITRYQNNPGVIYLQALLAENASDAVKLYQSIVENFGTSEWADGALYRLYQFYYSVGLYRTANQKLDELRKRFPHSIHLRGLPTSPTASKDEPISAVADTSTAEGFAVQVGAFSTNENANRLRDFFAGKGYPVRILSVVIGGKSYFLVWVGHAKTREEALALSSTIRKQYNIETMVVSR